VTPNAALPEEACKRTALVGQVIALQYTRAHGFEPALLYLSFVEHARIVSPQFECKGSCPCLATLHSCQTGGTRDVTVRGTVYDLMRCDNTLEPLTDCTNSPHPAMPTSVDGDLVQKYPHSGFEACVLSHKDICVPIGAVTAPAVSA